MSKENEFNGEFAQSPTVENDRQNSQCAGVVVDDGGGGGGGGGGLIESNFDSLNYGGNDIYWSGGYDEQYEDLLLFKEEMFRHKHCMGKAQKLIVANHLLQHKK
eukprot:15329098-Ditylum_brightwellii.AAC.1